MKTKKNINFTDCLKQGKELANIILHKSLNKEQQKNIVILLNNKQIKILSCIFNEILYENHNITLNEQEKKYVKKNIAALKKFSDTNDRNIFIQKKGFLPFFKIIERL